MFLVNKLSVDSTNSVGLLINIQHQNVGVQVRIFLALVNYHVDPNKITILSQYRAQCSSIEKQLKDFGFEHPNVGTVIASQGTFVTC